MRTLRIAAGLLMVPALVAGTIVVGPAAAQTSSDPAEAQIPSVGVAPIGTRSDDPNAGQWFIGEGGPGAQVRFVAKVTNAADVDQRVKMYISDLDFSDDGTPAIAKSSDDIGTWGKVEPDTVVVPAKKAIEVAFTLAVPAGADPGDHVGVLVAEGAPQVSGNEALFKVVKRVATRLYITVPGEARADVNIESVNLTPDSSFFPRETTVQVLVRNSGRVRLAPTVTINGRQAKGPDIILSNSVEPYLITEKVPLWGGPQSYRVDVATKVPSASGPARNGPARQARVSKFYVPFAPSGGLIFVLAALFGVRRLLRRRTGKYAALQADLRRFEKLLGDQSTSNGDTDSSPADPVGAIKQAIKQAGRAGDKATEEKLKAKLAEAETPAVIETAPQPVAVAPVPAAPPAEPPADASSDDAPDPIAVALGLVPPAPPASASTREQSGDGDSDENEDAPFELPMLAGERAGFSPMEPSELGGTIVNRSE